MVAGEVVLRDAADIREEGRRAVRLNRRHPRRHGGDLLLRAPAELIELFAGERGDGNAHVLQALRALLRDDDNFFQHRRLSTTRADQREGAQPRC